MKFCAASFMKIVQKTRYAKREVGADGGEGGGCGGGRRAREGGGGSQSEGGGC